MSEYSVEFDKSRAASRRASDSGDTAALLASTDLSKSSNTAGSFRGTHASNKSKQGDDGDEYGDDFEFADDDTSTVHSTALKSTKSHTARAAAPVTTQQGAGKSYAASYDSDSTTALLRSDSEVASNTAHGGGAGKGGAKSAAVSRAASHRSIATTANTRTQPNQQPSYADSAEETVASTRDGHTTARGARSQYSTAHTARTYSMAESVYSEDTNVDIVIRPAKGSQGGGGRVQAEESVAAGSDISLRPPPTAQSSQAAVRAGSSARGGLSLYESWDDEFTPTIIPARPQNGVATDSPVVSPTWHVPGGGGGGGADRPRTAPRTRPGSAGGASVGASLTSGSLAGALVGAPRPYSAARRVSRPASAGPHGRPTGEAKINILLQRSPRTWDVRDVADWVEYIGMSQYRKKFLHHCIDGPLLLGLTDAELKFELGVGPFGHRAAILQAIASLESEAGSAGMSQVTSPVRRPQRPMSAGGADVERNPAALTHPERYLGPALGRVTVYEQRRKLLYELERAAARAAQQRAIAEQLQHTAQLSAEEAAHLRGLLQDLERKNKSVVQSTVGTVDNKGRIPWRPSSPHTLNPHPERIGRPGDDPTVDMTFRPKISKRSQVLLQSNSNPGGHRSTFLDRLEQDAVKRERNRMESERRMYAAEVIYNDPLLAKRRAQKDYKYVSTVLQERNMLSGPIPDRDSESDEVIDSLLQRLQDEMKLPLKQLAAIQNAKGVRKVLALASALRTYEFMARYDKEDSERRSGAKLRELQEKHWEATLGNPKQRKAEEDMSQAVKWFDRLGWGGEDGITDDRLSALLRRATEFKKATEKARALKDAGQGDGVPVVDWTQHPWSTDGLGLLQDKVSEGNQAAIDATAAQAGANPGSAIKGPLAPDGTVSVTPADAAAGAGYLGYTVRLLSRCRWDDLEKMEGWCGSAKQLGVYRHVRTQKFIEFTDTEIRNKEKKLQQAYESSLIRPNKVLSKAEADAFYDRLLNDASKRQAAIEKAMQDKLERESKLIAASKTLGLRIRPKSAR